MKIKLKPIGKQWSSSPATCGIGPTRITAVSLRSKPVMAALLGGGA